MTAKQKFNYKIMKNLKTFIAIAFILVTISISCSKDEKIDSTNSAKFSSTELSKMKTDFIAIMNSTEYKTFHDSTNQMISKMKNEDFTFKNRQDFVDWIKTSGNLSKTDFTSTDDAIKLYDDSINALTTLRTKFNTFYDNLLNSDAEEFLEICAPEMIHPQLPTYEKSCAQGCVDTAIAAYHLEDLTYEYAMSTGDFGMIYYGTIAYHNANHHITQNYMNCFGSCPV